LTFGCSIGGYYAIGNACNNGISSINTCGCDAWACCSTYVVNEVNTALIDCDAIVSIDIGSSEAIGTIVAGVSAVSDVGACCGSGGYVVCIITYDVTLCSTEVRITCIVKYCITNGTACIKVTGIIEYDITYRSTRIGIA